MRGWGLASLICCCAALTWPTLAQSPPADGATGPTVTFLAADGDALWLVLTDANRATVLRREVSSSFERIDTLATAVVNVTACDNRLFVFTEGGAFYSLGRDGWSPERALPRRAHPVDVVGLGHDLYALVPSPLPGDVPRLVDGERPATTQPFDAGGAGLSVLRYDSQGWAGLVAVPAARPQAGPRLSTRLGTIRDVLCLISTTAGSNRVQVRPFDPTTGTWQTPHATPAVPGLVDLWCTSVAGVPTLATATAGSEEAGQEVVALRLLGELDAADPQWRPMQLNLSPLPAGRQPQTHRQIAGFNQHLALLLTATDGRSYLRFGRGDGDPAEQTVAIDELLTEAVQRDVGPSGWQTAALMALFGVVLALLVFRRGAMAQEIILPADRAQALVFQRLIGCLIDLMPFALFTALVTGVDWQAGARELFGWAMGSDVASGHLPPIATVLWWEYTVVSYTAYSLIMELITQRTIGKVVTGTHVASEHVEPAGWGAVVVRNMLRIVELQPPMWLLGFIVVLSRNRQRVGDIFARTIVLRRLRPPPEGEPGANEQQGDSEGES